MLVASPGQAGQQCQRHPVLHRNPTFSNPSSVLFIKKSFILKTVKQTIVSSVQDLVSLFNFHNYDNLRHFAKKLDPRREGGDQRVRFMCGFKPNSVGVNHPHPSSGLSCIFESTAPSGGK